MLWRNIYVDLLRRIMHMHIYLCICFGSLMNVACYTFQKMHVYRQAALLYAGCLALFGQHRNLYSWLAFLVQLSFASLPVIILISCPDQGLSGCDDCHLKTD